MGWMTRNQKVSCVDANTHGPPTSSNAPKMMIYLKWGPESPINGGTNYGKIFYKWWIVGDFPLPRLMH